MPPTDYILTLDQPDPSFGDHVTITVSPDPVEGGWLYLRVYQDGIPVLSEIHAAYDDGSAYGYHMPFALGPTASWDGGAATAEVELRIAKKGSIEKSRALATLEFSVAA